MRLLRLEVVGIVKDLEVYAPQTRADTVPIFIGALFVKTARLKVDVYLDETG